MDNRFLRGFTSDERHKHKPRRSTLDTSVAISSTGMNVTKPLSGKLNEEEQMRGLNDRLAGFIEKVRCLEHHSHLLEREIGEIRGRAKPASCLEAEYGPELGKLRQLIRDIAKGKHEIEIERANLEDELSNLRRQHEREARGRSDAESSIVVLKKDIGDAYRAKLQLDKKAQALVDEIHFLKRNHEAEVSEMRDQIQEAQVSLRPHEFSNPGVTAALRGIRAQLEGHAVSDLRQVGETFRSQFARLTEAPETKREALKATQQEIQEHRRRLQAKNIELDCAKGTREALEMQLHDVEDRHKEEMIHYQNTIKELENELINCKFDMSGYLREYQDLLNVKMALDVEILSYRKLLCGEEARLSTMSDTHISLPYIYHQSPVYTLPSLSRPGGPHRQPEPQYKFVEEIITETTREIEMSEFEETASEEMECTKIDRGGSEEDKDNKDGGEDGGEQMSDCEQNQVGNSNIGGEVDDGEKGQKSEEGSEESDDMDKSAQSKVLLSESLDEEGSERHQKVAENKKAEKEAAVTVLTDQRELSSKADDLESEIPAEEEHPKKSDDGKKGDAGKESLAQARKPVDQISAQVPKESDKTQKPSSVVLGQGKVHTFASETAERSTDFTAETKSVLSIETEKAHVSFSTTPKSEEKETGKSDAVKLEDKVAKSIQGVQPDSNKVQDKESYVQSNGEGLPEVEDQKPMSGDKTQTVQTELPKQKITAIAEIKEPNQGVPESSHVEKSKLLESTEKINEPHGKTEKVESSKPEK